MSHELDRLPPTNAYRDFPVAPALARDVVDAFRQSRWSLRERPLAPKDLMTRLDVLPRVRDWLAAAIEEDLLVDHVLVLASALAKGQLAVRTLHALRIIADARWLEAPPRLIELIDRQVAVRETSTPSEEPTLSEDLAVLVAKTNVYARMAQRSARSDMLLAIALREDAVAAIFEEAGMHVPSLLQNLAHGTRDVPDDPTMGMADVVFHHDDFTPVEVVEDAMRRHFDVRASEAKDKIASAHDEGEVVAATYGAAEARARADRARLEAQASRLPLRITLRPAT